MMLAARLSARGDDSVDHRVAEVRGWTTPGPECSFPGDNCTAPTFALLPMRRVDIHYCPV